MEIIHLVLGKANPERMNGVNKVVSQLAAHQCRMGRDVSIWGITRNPDRNFGERSYRTDIFPAARHPFGVSKPLRKAIAGKAGQDAVFHLHGGWVPVYATISRLLDRHGIRFVITAHGAYNSVAMQRSKWLKRIYFRLFERPMLQKAHKVHSIGQSEAEGLEAIYPNSKGFLLPYGFEPASTPQGRMPAREGFTIGFVGRLDTWTKGLDLLIRAFHEFQKTENDSRLWIVGEGPGRSALEDFITENGVSNVVLWGSKFGSDKDYLLSQMHVFAHPSRNEGLPASVLEAAAAGIPLVVSHQTNTAEQVARYKAGIAIADTDVKSLLKAFKQLKQHNAQTMDTLSDNAMKMVSEEYSWEKLVPQFDEIYC